MMLEMDGFAVLEQIRKTNTDVAVVMLAAYTEETYIKTATKLGIILQPQADSPEVDHA